jgi:hypothetical protein
MYAADETDVNGNANASCTDADADECHRINIIRETLIFAILG